MLWKLLSFECKNEELRPLLCHLSPWQGRAGFPCGLGGVNFPALLQCCVSAGRATCCHWRASQVREFPCTPSSQAVHSFIHTEELWASTAQWVDAGALWQAMEEGKKEPRHSSDCMPKSQASQNARFKPVANKWMKSGELVCGMGPGGPDGQQAQYERTSVLLWQREPEGWWGESKRAPTNIDKEVIILFYSALDRLQLEDCVQFWYSPYKKDVDRL